MFRRDIWLAFPASLCQVLAAAFVKFELPIEFTAIVNALARSLQVG